MKKKSGKQRRCAVCNLFWSVSPNVNQTNYICPKCDGKKGRKK